MRFSTRRAGLIAMLLASAGPSHGQITIDGTLPGTSFEVLEGPDFDIPASKGHQVGPNLFHSFDEFSIGAGGSATFTPEGSSGAIDNVLSRVTGPNPSLLDGRLASTIPGADVYLMNPNGIIFGRDASLDVPASFYAGAADFVELNDGGRFFGDLARASALTVAPVSDFGFLQLPGGPILVAGAELHVPVVAEMSLVGGFLGIDSGSLLAAPNGYVRLHAPSGQVRIQSETGIQIGDGSSPVAPNGVQIIGKSVDLDAAGGGGVAIAADQGHVSLENGTVIDASGGGSVAIHGKNVLFAGTASANDEPGGNAVAIGRIGIFAGNVAVIMGAIRAEEIRLRAEDLTLDGAEILSINGDRDFFSHAIFMEASSASLSRTIVQSDSHLQDFREPGAISISIDGNLRLTAESEIRTAASGLGSVGGDISIAARDLSMDRSSVQTATKDGVGGDVLIAVDESVRLTADSEIKSTSSGFGGDGGDILIAARDLSIDLSRILIENDDGGDTGSVRISGADSVRMQSSTIGSSSTGNGGGVTVQVRSLLLLRDSEISLDGRAGADLDIDPTFIVMDASRISVRADLGRGGNLRVIAEFLVLSPDSVIEASGRLLDLSSLDKVPTGELAAEIAGEGPVKVQESRCATRDRAVGTLMHRGQGGTPHSPQGMLVAYSTMGATP